MSFSRKLKRKTAKSLCIASCIAGLLSSSAFAANLPQNSVVKNGMAQIQINNTVMDINNIANKTVINWNSFDVAKGYTVNFNFAESNAYVLNRVVLAGNPSQLYGTLYSDPKMNGTVILINPNGITLGQGVTLNVPHFIGSTLNISDQDLNQELNKDTTLASFLFGSNSTNSPVNANGVVLVDSEGIDKNSTIRDLVLVGGKVTVNGPLVAEGTATTGQDSRHDSQTGQGWSYTQDSTMTSTTKGLNEVTLAAMDQFGLTYDATSNTYKVSAATPDKQVLLTKPGQTVEINSTVTANNLQTYTWNFQGTNTQQFTNSVWNQSTGQYELQTVTTVSNSEGKSVQQSQYGGIYLIGSNIHLGSQGKLNAVDGIGMLAIDRIGFDKDAAGNSIVRMKAIKDNSIILDSGSQVKSVRDMTLIPFDGSFKGTDSNGNTLFQNAFHLEPATMHTDVLAMFGGQIQLNGTVGTDNTNPNHYYNVAGMAGSLWSYGGDHVQDGMITASKDGGNLANKLQNLSFLATPDNTVTNNGTIYGNLSAVGYQAINNGTVQTNHTVPDSNYLIGVTSINLNIEDINRASNTAKAQLEVNLSPDNLIIQKGAWLGSTSQKNYIFAYDMNHEIPGANMYLWAKPDQLPQTVKLDKDFAVNIDKNGTANQLVLTQNGNSDSKTVKINFAQTVAPTVPTLPTNPTQDQVEQAKNDIATQYQNTTNVILTIPNASTTTQAQQIAQNMNTAILNFASKSDSDKEVARTALKGIGRAIFSANNVSDDKKIELAATIADQILTSNITSRAEKVEALKQIMQGFKDTANTEAVIKAAVAIVKKAAPTEYNSAVEKAKDEVFAQSAASNSANIAPNGSGGPTTPASGNVPVVANPNNNL